MLVLAPAACCLAGVAMHDALTALFNGVHGRKEVPASRKEEPVRPKKATKGAAKVSCLDATWLRAHHCLAVYTVCLLGDQRATLAMMQCCTVPRPGA